MPQKSILVTGSSGVIGTALANELLEQGYDVTGVDRVENRWSPEVDAVTIQGDLRDDETMDVLPEDIDFIVHLAANSRVGDSLSHPETAVANVESTFNVLQFAEQSDNARVLMASSREVYGESDAEPAVESDATIQGIKNPYGASKVSSEALGYSFASSFDLDISVIRLTNVYGRYDISDRVVPTFITNAQNGEELVVYGSNKILDFIYIDDCVSGFLLAIDHFEEIRGSTINIGSGNGVSLEALARKVIGILDADSAVRVLGPRTGEVDQFVADINKANQRIGFEPTVSLEEGLADTIAWHERC